MPIDNTPDQGEVLRTPDPKPFPRQPGEAKPGAHTPPEKEVDADRPDAGDIRRRPSLP